MIRWMISPIIGTGTFLDTYRASVGDIPNVNTSAIIPTHTSGPDIGKPKYGFALCLVATANIGAISQVTNSLVFPDYNLDGRMDGMESGARTGFKQSIEAYDLNGNGLNFDASHVDADSYRDLITRLGQQIEPAFAINAMAVAEVAQ